MSAAASAGAAGAAAAIAQATKASGVIVRVNRDDFLQIVNRNGAPLVVEAIGGFFHTVHMYLTSYRGLAFFAKSDVPLSLPHHCEVIKANKIWISG
jgi:hypothetical protein